MDFDDIVESFFYCEDLLLMEEDVLFVVYFFLEFVDVFFYEGDFFICDLQVDLLSELFID